MGNRKTQVLHEFLANMIICARTVQTNFASCKERRLTTRVGYKAVGKQYPSLIQAFIAMSYCTGSKGHKRYKRRPSPVQAFISMSYCAGSKGPRQYKRRPSPMQAFIKATVRVQREDWMIRDSYYTSFAREG